MTFLTYSKSVQDALPVELYEFRRGTTYRRYTTAPINIVYLSKTYTSSPIKRSSIIQTENMNRGSVDFELPKTDSFALYYLQRTVAKLTYVNVYRTQYNDPDEEYQTWWKGRLTGVSVKDNKITLQAEPIFTSQKRPGLRRVYESMCANTLYDVNCGVSRSLYQYTATVSTVSGTVVSVSSLGGAADDYYSGGFINTVNDGYRYHISKQTGTDLTLFSVPEIEATDSILVYPGCDHTFDTCKDKFSNSANFGGFPFMPNRNPFQGSLT